MVLRTKLPSYQNVELKPGQTFNLNTTVPTQNAVFISVYDAITNQRAYINGRSIYLVFPKSYLVPIRPTGKFSYVHDDVSLYNFY